MSRTRILATAMAVAAILSIGGMFAVGKLMGPEHRTLAILSVGVVYFIVAIVLSAFIDSDVERQIVPPPEYVVRLQQAHAHAMILCDTLESLERAANDDLVGAHVDTAGRLLHATARAREAIDSYRMWRAQ